MGVRRVLTVSGGRSPDDVWDRYVRPSRWAEWSPQISTVDYGHERLQAGTAGVVNGVGGLRVPFTILAVDEADPARRSWVWRAGVMGVELEFEHVVESSPSGGATTVLVVQGPLPGVLPYLPLAWVALTRLVT